MGGIERPRGCVAVATVFRTPTPPQAEALPLSAVTARGPQPLAASVLHPVCVRLPLVRVSSGCDHSEWILTCPAHPTERDVPRSVCEVAGVRTSLPVGRGQGCGHLTHPLPQCAERPCLLCPWSVSSRGRCVSHCPERGWTNTGSSRCSRASCVHSQKGDCWVIRSLCVPF